MPTPSASDRISELESRIAELERHHAPKPARRRRGTGWTRRLALVALALALTVPAGVVLASHRFNDVPTGHQFHNAISAIADAGITTGCPQGTNNFCPDGLVTRGQMAAFLSRLGALTPGSAPKVNADRLDGFDASAFSRTAYATMRPDECFGPTFHCTIYRVKGVDHIRRVATGTYCVAPTAGRSFAGVTPSFSIDAFNSGPANGLGTPSVAYSTLASQCNAGEMQVHTYRSTGSGPTVAASDSTSFGIVIP